LVFLLVLGIQLGRLAFELSQSRLAQTAGILAVAIAPSLAFSGASGMEVSLAALCLTASVRAFLKGADLRAGFLAGLAGLSRPELGLAPLVYLVVVALRRQGVAARAKAALRIVVWPIIGAAAWCTYCFVVTGRPLPNTFYAKFGPSMPWGPRLEYLFERILFSTHAPFPDPGGIVWVACWVVCFIAGVGVSRRGPEQKRAIAFVLTFLVVSVATLIGTHELRGSILFYYQRYFYPVTALGVVVVAIGVGQLAAALSKWLPKRLAATLVLILATAAAAPSWLSARASYAGHCAQIRALHTEPALALFRQSRSDARVGAEGAGSVRYHSERTVIDLLGLNFFELAHHLDDPDSRVCLLVNSDMNLVVVPSFWLEQLAPVFDYRVLEVYRVGESAMSAEGGEVTVVLAAVAAREGMPEACRARAAISNE
ncbi:MAG: hypothetical protein KC561_01135, partial [Myxococcales bacterium]|nr:hypothetical protein [Myxococcales bacterium]